MDYTEFIEAAPLLSEPQETITTGDPQYRGTAVEIRDGDVELFDVVVADNGQVQWYFFPVASPYRIPLDVIERLVRVARERVRSVD